MNESSTIVFSPAALAALDVPGVSERWAAVQEHLHPLLALLAARLDTVAARRLPRLWPLYEISYKTQRYVNKGRSNRAPIDEYHLAIDRVPRGSGVVVAISSAERTLLVGLQLWGTRKRELRAVWEQGRAVWQPLVARIAHHGQARFTPTQSLRRKSQASSDEAGSTAWNIEPTASTGDWLDDYLAARTSYLWAGFVYRWDDPRLQDASFADQLIEDILALLPLNEAIMEQAEAFDPTPAALLREHRAAFLTRTLPQASEIVAAIAARGFTYPETTVRAYHVALQTRPLVILPGISGTGKTRLTRLYADAVHRIAPGQPNPFYLLIAVQPDWHSARDLLGFYNSLTGSYHPTPFLRFLLRATAEPQELHFVCLDEMNLARPEYYLAPLLSAMETADQTFDLGIPADSAQALSGELVPNPLRLPHNLRISGTLNVDESSHALSDKLLDRANVIELTDVDLDAFRARYNGSVDEASWQTISAIHRIVASAGQPFGYRVIGEILRFIEVAAGELPLHEALDLQIKQKVLPKLRGEDSPRLRQALDALLALFTPDLPQSAEKVVRMKARLLSDGFTDFYG